MAGYEVTAKDGTVYEVDLPETSFPTSSRLNILQKAFLPSNVVREVVGGNVTRDLTGLQQMVGATPVGQAASTVLAPPQSPGLPTLLRFMAQQAPQRIGQVAGSLAAAPVDPSTYAFGAIGAVPGLGARATLGAAVGGLTAVGQPDVTVPSILRGMALGGIGSGATRVDRRGIRVATSRQKQLQQAERMVEAADKTVLQVSDQQVMRLRQGGDLHDRVMQTLSQESEKAWAPMKSVTSAIPGRIQPDEVWQQLQSQLADKPERLAAARLFMDDLESAATSPTGYRLPKSGRSFDFTASDWSDLSSEVGSFIRRSQHKGKAAFNLGELIKNDLRSAVGGVLESRAPDTHKGLVRDALFRWAGYASDRDTLFELFAPGAHPNVSPKRGTNFLERAAKGTLDPYEQRFLTRMVETSGIDLPATIRPHAIALFKAQQTQQRLAQPPRSVIKKALGYGTGLLAGTEYLRRKMQ